MKKLVLILCMLPIVAFAQTDKLFVGGDISYYSIDQKMDNSTLSGSNTDSFIFNPRVGYYLSPNLAIGLSCGYGSGSTNSTKNHQVAVAPFALYHFYRSGNLSFVGYGSVGYRYYQSRSLEGGVYVLSDKTHMISVSVSPGITYDLNKHFRLETYLGSVNYYHTREFPVHMTTNTFSMSFSNSLSFGFLYFF